MNKTICAALALAALLCGCGNMTEGITSAKAQVAAFHQHMNAQDFGAIMSAADPDMFRVSPRTDVQSFLTVVHSKLGDVTDSQITTWNVRTFNGATTVVLVQNTKFQRGSGTETFTFRVRDKQAYLLGYDNNSRDLVMR